MKEQYELALGISITNSCYDCMQMDEKCQDCTDLADARLTDKAHEIVDEGNGIYTSQWLRITEPSGHDWTDREGEYKSPTVFLSDGGAFDETWELSDERQAAREKQCPWCYIMTPKVFDDCQSCDKPVTNPFEELTPLVELREIEMAMHKYL